MQRITQNEFFRGATLRICGTLDIEEGLQACYEYFSQYLPVDSVFLERHAPDRRGIEIVAEASASKSLRTGVLIPLPDEFRQQVKEEELLLAAGKFPDVLVINRPQESPIGLYILEAIGAPTSSYMGLPLIVDGELVGALSVIAEGDDRYSDHHQRLLATLKEPFFTAMSNVLRHQEAVQLKNRLAEENRELQRELMQISGDEIIGSDFGLREVMHKIRHVAHTDSPVLLMGETGVGKDVVANAIHISSQRRNGPLIPVNCGAIPGSLLESELFGHEKGAFTGAISRKRGRFERADGGTILLDEIGEMPIDAQVRLLRVLQQKEIERVGGTESISVDIRVIAATNRDLRTMVDEGRFREDLFFRLSVFPVVIPPLRQRVSDIPALAQFFIERKANELKIGYTPRLALGAIDNLKNYSWPGNVRELENVIERALILHQDGELRFNELHSAIGGAEMPGRSLESGDSALTLDEFQARHIARVLEMAEGKIHGPGGAGELLGVNPNTLRYRMEKLGIDFRKRGGKV